MYANQERDQHTFDIPPLLLVVTTEIFGIRHTRAVKTITDRHMRAPTSLNCQQNRSLR